MANAYNACCLESSQTANTAELLARHRAGDRRALELLVQQYYPRIERIVRVRLGRTLLQRETVADVVQDVLVRVVEGVDRFEVRDDARWIDWVARLAQNEIANHARRALAQKRGGVAGIIRAQTQALSSVLDDTASVGSKVARREMVELIDRCLSALPEAQREVLILRDYAGMDWKAVAEHVDRPSVEACQELHRRARRQLEALVQRRL